MARIRSIKPSFFRSEDVTALSYRARLTWIGLWLYADDEGRLRDDARFVKGDLWALEDEVSWQDVEADLQELAEHDRIVRYEVGGRRFIQVQKWSDHQAIPKATKSKLPPPSSGDFLPSSPTGSGQEKPLPAASGSAPALLPTGSGEGDGSRREEVGTSRSARARDTPLDRFEEFWAIYPRRADKPAAIKAWAKATQKADVDVILAGTHRYASDPNRVDQFTKHPGPWLNAEGWNDAPLPDRNGAATAVESPTERINRLRTAALTRLEPTGDHHGDTTRLPRPALDARAR